MRLLFSILCLTLSSTAFAGFETKRVDRLSQTAEYQKELLVIQKQTLDAINQMNVYLSNIERSLATQRNKQQENVTILRSQERLLRQLLAAEQN